MKNKTLRLVMAALLAAMTCVATMVIKIPITATGGYINLGDCIVLLSGILLGPLYGGLAAVAAIPGNAIQGIVGLILAMLLIPVFRICNLPSFRNE